MNKRIVFVMSLICFIIISNFAFAQESKPLEVYSYQFWINILNGAFLGFMTVLVGWAKKQEPGKFDYKGLIIRVPTGVIVGVAASIKGISFDEAYSWAAGVGVIMIVDNIIKMIMRKWCPEYYEKKLKIEKK